MKHFVHKIGIALAAILLLAGCTSRPELTPEEASTLIQAFSPATIGTSSNICIEPSELLRQSIDSTARLDRLFRFTPSLAGQTHWSETKQQLCFTPEAGALQPGKSYRCVLDLAELTGVDTLADFAFSFSVKERVATLQEPRILIDPHRQACLIVRGSVLFSEPVSYDEASSLFTFTGDDGITFEIEQEDPEQWEYAIHGIELDTRARAEKISFRADKIGFGKAVERTIILPGRNFELLQVRLSEGTNTYLEIEFSAPIDCDQELEGLITLKGSENCRIRTSRYNTSCVRLFFDPLTDSQLTLKVSSSVRSAQGQRLPQNYVRQFTAADLPPSIKVPLSGTILPDGSNLRFPFQTINLKAVDVEVVKIYADNVLTFLQENALHETDNLRRVGRAIHKQTVRLDADTTRNLREWQSFAIDLKGLFRQERGAIYNVQLSFKEEYALSGESASSDLTMQRGLTPEEEAEWDQFYPYIYNNGYNLVASNLGLIVKKADGDRLWTTVSDIMTTKPISGVTVTAYNYQLRPIGQGKTNAQGFADFTLSGVPFVVTAEDGQSVSYLRMRGGDAQSNSRFDVSGQKPSKTTLKGFVYGERGVWRPGDEICLTLLLEDRNRVLPKQHPVTLELFTPQGQCYTRQTQSEGVDGFYLFRIATEEAAPTGHWQAKFQVGGATFEYPVQIETIKPNRLKIKIESPEIIQAGKPATIGLQAHWLTGPAADGLAATMEWTLHADATPFADYKSFHFTNPLTEFSSSKDQLITARLDSVGHLSRTLTMPAADGEPGLLWANLIARVTEAGGDESITSRMVRYAPYDAYVGICLGERTFETDTDLTWDVVTVDAEGRPLANRKLDYSIYRLDWSWWFEGSAQELATYMEGSSVCSVASSTLTTSTEGMATIQFRLDYPSWGRYLILVHDRQSGHSTGGVVSIDWPEWRGRSGRQEPSAATMLAFSLDKKNYEVGEQATVYLPRAEGGRVLLSVENGSRVISRRWITLSKEQETAFKLPVTHDMTPNFYLHATLLQPHNRPSNDLPLRLYGIERADVVDRSTVLHPEIELPDEVLPQQPFTVGIRERDGKPMSYTLALVDEGLLDITSFRTPQPWQAMYQREALGVSTWDLYGDVIGAQTGQFHTLLSIGGDMAVRSAQGKEKRFNPVVKVLGPFTLKKGSATHTITLPIYVGSVRVMVVAAHEGCYGSADRTMKVQAPLMLLPSLPRRLVCGDRVSLPVQLFATRPNIGKTQVQVAVDGPLSIVGPKSHQLTCSEPCDKQLNFELQCDKVQTGRAHVIVSASSASYHIQDTITIEVCNPLPKVIHTQPVTLSGGKTQRFNWTPFTHGETRLEVSAMPAIDFSGTFAFVEQYEHYCSEQLSARAMYMLYARQFLSSEEQQQAEQALPKFLQQLISRQMRNGGFRYWPSSHTAHDWVTSMAGEVLIEARRQGFPIQGQVIERWQQYQTQAARQYAHSTRTDIQQAYRLYTLVKSGNQPLAAMNRLREESRLSRQAVLRLAAAYAWMGRTGVAHELATRAATAQPAAGDYSTFSSPLRDQAMELQSWALLGASEQMLSLAEVVAAKFSATTCDTQQVAFISAAFGSLAEQIGTSVERARVEQQGSTPIELCDIRATQVLDVQPDMGSLSLQNQGTKPLFATLVTLRQPTANEPVVASANKLTLEVQYTDLKGQPCAIHTLQQGAEFLAQITVKRNAVVDSESLALTFVAPSGWEIWNDRLLSPQSQEEVTYSDQRDDRIQWYFPLDAGQSKQFKVRLRAAYTGQFLLPPTRCEDMYDATGYATTASRMITVKR